MEKIELRYQFDGAVAYIRLSAPKGNILDKQMMNEITRAFGEFEENRAVKAVVLEGAGKNFSFGASVEEHKKEMAREMLQVFHRMLQTISGSHIPVISKIKGYCLGGALELVLSTHLVFAHDSAVFGQPEINLGVFPPPASLLLPLKIGYGSAEELLVSGRNFSANEACRYGLVNYLFEDLQKMDDELDQWLKKNVIPKSASSLRMAVKASRMQLNDLIEEKFPQLESLYLDELMETNDANEGINAFLEKRKPKWKNE